MRMPTRAVPAVLPIVLALVFSLGGLVLVGPTEAARAASPLYPDLRTVPPRDLQLAQVTIDGATHHVLRFSNTAWNAGRGRLEVRGTPSPGATMATQRIYDDGGGFTDQPVGQFVFHAAHNHWHFEDFAQYELWLRADYDAWLASGRTQGQAQRQHKATFCIVDTYRVQSLPGSPAAPAYSRCDQGVQGLSVGWGDTYRSNLADQWIDLGPAPLLAGQYVLRSVADPLNRLYESAGQADAAVESQLANEAVTFFRVNGARLRPITATDEPPSAAARAGNLVDAKLWSTWQTSWSYPPQLSAVLDLGSSQPVGHVRWFVATGGLARDISFRVRDEGGPWRDVALHLDGGTASNTWQTTDLNVTGRYLRITVLPVGRQARLGGVGEIELYRAGPGVSITP